jgi:ubiquitin carboxyl-terminal hydrolase 34
VIEFASGERRWFEFNDKNVSLFDPQDLGTECFGGFQTVTHWDSWQRQYVQKTYDRVRSAYMLIYERVCPLLSPQNKLAKELQPDENAKDVSCIRCIPAALYKRVWEENSQFLRDRQLFNPNYFEFMLQFCRLTDYHSGINIVQSPLRLTGVTDTSRICLDEESAFQVIKFFSHFLLDTLVHAKDAEHHFAGENSHKLT